MRVGNDVDEWNAVIENHDEVVNNAKEQQTRSKQLKIKHKVGATQEDALILLYEAREKCMQN